MTPALDFFAENPSRGIFITREIDHGLYKELIPQIVSLRATPHPICLYIESNGGQIFFADLITNLIQSPNQFGKRNHLITVGVGFVASCAADLLAMGDYAIAYPFAHIHYHGTRQQADEITLQKIPLLAGNLRDTNEQYAFRLAGKMFKRMTFHILEKMLEKTIPKSGNPPIESVFDISKIDKEIESFEKRLRDSLADINKDTGLLDESLKKRTKFNDLVRNLRAYDSARPGEILKDHPTLYKHLLDIEVKSNPKSNLTQLLPIIEDDFQQVGDFFFGKYQKDLNAIIMESQGAFLTPNEQKQWQSHKTEPEKLQYIIKTVSPRLEPLWFLVVSLARTLQDGEFPMNAFEAYSLGLVDEVINSGLPSLRSRAEEMRAIQRNRESTPPAPSTGAGKN